MVLGMFVSLGWVERYKGAFLLIFGGFCIIMISMSKFWKVATLIGVILTVVIWGALLVESMGRPFLQDCFRLGDGGYCADYRYTEFGKMVVAGAVMVPVLTVGVFVIGKIKGTKERSGENERRVKKSGEGHSEGSDKGRRESGSK